MSNPFEVLGLHGSADADEIRAAYRALVKKCHPDQFLDAEEQRAAQELLHAAAIHEGYAFHGLCEGCAGGDRYGLS